MPNVGWAVHGMPVVQDPKHNPGAVSDQPVVVAILAVHNRLPLTKRCLQALARAAVRTRLQMVVVDDGSNDGTTQWVALNFPEATVLPGDGHLWFGGSVQAGIDHILAWQPRPSHVLILNNDSFMRPGAVDEMVAAAGRTHSVAASYWTEDLKQPNSAGYLWIPGRGFSDVCDYPGWKTAHGSGERRFLPVDAVATTACLHPVALVARARRVSLRWHRQNRYDSVLSAHLREAGARFLVSTHFLADHLFGSTTNRPTLRTVSLREFLRLTLADPLSVYYLPGVVDALWRIAPRHRAALRPIARQLARFIAETGAKLLQTMFACIGVRLWRSAHPGRQGKV